MSTLPLPESPPARIEDEIEKLESLVRELETGQEGLEHALALFEQGVRLTAQCQIRLEAFDQRILEVTREADGSASVKTFAHDPTHPGTGTGRS
jgi:exodeoxyribonuclease VII small subunit